MWNYHLRRPALGAQGEPVLFPGGGAPAALCGKALGWDTKTPLEAWGGESHIPQSWCGDCHAIAQGGRRVE